jgi:hypothetical protein
MIMPRKRSRLDEVPDLRRQVALLVDLPVVDAPAQFLDRAVEERLFLRVECARLEREQLVPLRHAAEQIAVPPDRAGLERDAFGVAQARQHLGELRHHPARDQRATQRRQAEHDGQHDEHEGGDGEQVRRGHAGDAPAE